MSDRRILLGRIVGVSGLDGSVKLHSFTEPRENIFRYRPWSLVLGAETRVVDKPQGRPQGRGLVAKLPGVSDRDQAAALMGAEIWVARERLPKPKPGEYYWVDLEDLAVVTVEGVALGRVSHLFATGANDVMVVKGDRERLIPFVLGHAVKRVDLDARIIEVDWDPEF